MGRNAQGILDEAGVLEKIITSIETADAAIASCYRHQPKCEMIGLVRKNLMRERATVIDALTAVAGAGGPFVVARLAGGHSKHVAVALFEAIRAEELNPPPPMTEERKARLAREIEELEAREAAEAEAAIAAEAVRRGEERREKMREGARRANEARRGKQAEQKRLRHEKKTPPTRFGK